MDPSYLQSRPTRFRRAFTLIELLVVTGIIVVVSTIVLADNNRFGGVVLLQNLAYNVALSIRQAQVYGISVHRSATATVCNDGTQNSNFCSGYGVHFDLSSPGTYVLFSDGIEQNGLYDCPQPGTGNCELVQTTDISSGYSIHDLCVTPASGGETCGIPKIDILFQRPEPDAWISSSGVSCIIDNSACAEGARITLISPRGDLMSISIEANGQISVQH